MMLYNNQAVLKQILSQREGQLSICGFEVAWKWLEEESGLNLSTPVFEGGNYIPGRVRECVRSQVYSDLLIDESQFRILLRHHSTAEQMSEVRLCSALREFIEEANKWRSILDEHGKQDLVYVHISR